jgi:hypothetical protein
MASLALHSPHEQAVARSSRILLGGIAVGALIALLGFTGSISASVLSAGSGAAAAGGLAGALRSVLLIGFAGSLNEAMALLALLGMASIAAFLVALVGAGAREIWALPLPWLIAAANVLLLALVGFTPGILLAALAGLAGVRQAQSARAFRVNPVALKEVRGRMRGGQAFVVLAVYLTLMSVFALLIYFAFNAASRVGSSAAGEVGRALFLAVVGIEMLLILVIAPSLTSGAITGERERQTYDLLRTTLLTAPTFVLGKLESAVAYLLLLLLAAVPLQSIAFLFGGVSEGEIVLAFIILVVTALALGAVGIYFSTASNRTIAANARAYIVVLGLMFVAPAAAAFALEVLGQALFVAGQAGGSPVLETLFVYASAILSAINPAMAALTSQQILIERSTIGFYPYTLASTGGAIPLVSPWLLFVIFYLTLASLLLLLAVRRTRRDDAEGGSTSS